MHAQASSTVLIVDDSPSVRDSLERTLSRRGYEVLTAVNTS